MGEAYLKRHGVDKGLKCALAGHIKVAIGGSGGTCQEHGYIKYSCDCGLYTHTEDTGLGTHYYIKIIDTQPTCTEDGMLQNVCQHCEDEQTTIRDALGHLYPSHHSTKPCNSTATTYTLTCERCGKPAEFQYTGIYHNIYTSGDKAGYCGWCDNKIS